MLLKIRHVALKMKRSSGTNIKKNSPAKKSPKKFGVLEVEDVCKLKLEDRMGENLDVVFAGINPGLMSAYKGHHYAGHNNHFWPCLNNSGLIPIQLTCNEDHRCPEFGIGLTNIVERTTRGASDLKKDEIVAGRNILIEKIKKCNPLVVCFNGKGIYEIFAKKKCDVGLQDEKFPGCNAAIYVMPSSSGRTISYPRWQDKLRFYHDILRLRDSRKLTRDKDRHLEINIDGETA